jgi:predicted esterase
MKMSTKSFIVLLLALAAFFTKDVSGQSIMNPGDTVYTYNSSATKGSSTNPNQPATQNTIGKWIRTVRLSWNTSNWKCYIYNGVPFRIRFPLTYNPTANDGKKYPMMVFFHGLGEAGPATDNEYQLYHGGNVFEAQVASGNFDGYIIAMQSTGSWGSTHNTYISQIIDYMIQNNKLDPFRVSFNGLSAGGYNTWNFMEQYPQYTTSALPMSGISIYDEQYVNLYKFTPIWYFQGGLDGSPAQNTADQVNAVNVNAGANYLYHIYPTLGHGTWDSTWAQPDFWPWLGRVYMSNPWPLFGRTQFCPGTPINVTIGVVPGLDAYQWRMNGNLISGATKDSIVVTQTGTYDCRMQRLGVWSDWSHVPVVISLKTTTVTPDITLSGLQSKVIPSLSGPNITMTEPSGYATYKWMKGTDTTTLGTSSSYTTSSPGTYYAQVTEKFGCSTQPSNPYTVVSASGANNPDPASGLVASALSQTSVFLVWSQNPTPTYNETNFEIYRSTTPGGPYTLVDITGADVSKDTIRNLNSGTTYYFVVRAVNNSGAAAGSNEASAKTVADTVAPTAPTNLTISGTTRSSISLSWTAATDNVGVVGYDVYVNGTKSYTIASGTQTTFTVYGLNQGQNYALSIKAKDQAGNISPASNQVSGQPLLVGLPYSTYLIPTSSTVLPDFGTLTPVSSGVQTNISITSPAPPASSWYAYLWQGYIIIPTTGNYTFETSSDDGSRLWLGSLGGTTSPYSFSGTPLVNNDGGHGTTTKASSVVSLTAGVYPIAIGYCNFTGGAAMSILWKTPGSSSYVTIPNSAFNDNAVNNGSAPAAPSNLVATSLSYSSIGLTWKDNSTTEQGFEVWRSTSASGTFTPIGTVSTGVTSFTDNNLSGSTKYYYQVRAINTYGQSAFTSSYVEAEWKFNNNYNDSSGNGRTLSQANNPTFDAANKVEGTYSVKLNGTSQNMTIPATSTWLMESYSQRTFSCWIKPTVTTGTYRMVWDIGGSDNGICLAINNNTLVAGVASNNVRASISTPFTSLNWNHVVVVYNGDSLLLYVNGAIAASNTSLSFHSLLTTTNGSRIGQVNSSNALNQSGSTYYSGWVDDFTIFNMALSTSAVNSVMNFSTNGAVSYATTGATPAVPSAPTVLAANANGSSSINLTWTNNASNASNIQVYRSAGDNQTYVLWATLPGNAASYTDNGLFSNAKYYYKVNAVNPGGTSAYSNEVNATTLDVAPVMTKLSNQQVHYGQTSTIQLKASSVNSGLLAFTSTNLPAFASIANTTNTTGTLTLNPAQSDSGSYPITIYVTDAFGGKDSTKFNLAVNNQYPPTLDSIGNYVLFENDTVTIPLTGHNINSGDVMTIAVSGLPTAYTLTQTGNGTAALLLHPNYAAAGTYTPTVTVNDANGLSASRNFTLQVNYKDPNVRTYMHINGGDSTVPGWNNISNYLSTSGFIDQYGNNSGMTLDLEPAWWWNTKPIAPLGANTGNNSGIYPDGVLKDYYFFGIWGGPDTPVSTLGGLDTASLYNLTFFGSSNWSGESDNGWTTYAAGGQSATLHIQNNSTQAVTLNNIKPDANGNIVWKMYKKDANTPLGYFNALVVTKIFDDGTPPAAPVQLYAQNAPTLGGVKLTWVDKAYNETGYQIVRSVSAAGPYNSIGSVASKATSFIDTTVSGGVQYWYRVNAFNTHGVSPFTDSFMITTTDRIPKVNPIASVSLTSGQSTTVSVTAVDDPADHLTLTASNLPAFASFVDNGNGTGTITIAPGPGNNGVYSNVTITATDMSDSSRGASFNIYVVEKNISSTYLNFSDTSVAPAPWNNLLGIPFAGTTISNLVDDGGVNTGVSVQIVGGFDGVVGHGMRPRNSTAVYPEAVTSTGYFAYSTAQRAFKITGLNTAKTYNFVLFGSYFDNSNCNTIFGINSQTLALNASYNCNKTVQFNGITPDNTGTVVITMTKDSAAFISVISSLVIQAYDPTVITPVMAPADLRVVKNTKNSISVQWQDRSVGETGFELWRSTSSSGNYILLASLPAGTTSYTDNSLSSNAYYYYTVRAVKSGAYTSYSNTATGYTYASIIDIAFNGAQSAQAPYPWNNLNNIPQLGFNWYNFINDIGQTTNVGMLETGNDWAGIANGLGVNTGNNSGIFPDAVQETGYVLFPGQTGSVQLTGLNLSQTYDLTFFNSITGTSDASSIFTVNGQTTILNGTLNQSGTSTIYGLTPDANGNMYIQVDPFTTNSQFGLLNGLLVKGHTNNPSNAPVAPSVASPVGTTVTSVNQVALTNTVTNTDQDGLKSLTAYPNPFKDAFTLAVQTSDLDKVMVSLTDLSGRQVYQKQFEGLVQGTNLLSIHPNGSLTKGVYLVSVVYTKTGVRKTISVVKE